MYSIQIIYNKIFEKNCIGILSGAHRGQVKFHSEKCCGSPYILQPSVISGVWTLNTLHANIGANY